MIEIIDKVDSQRILKLLRQDYGVNYFIRLGLQKAKPAFKRIWLQSGNQPEAVMLQRFSGNIHIFAIADAELNDFASILKALNFKKIMGDLPLILKLHHHLPDLEITENSFIASYDLSKHDNIKRSEFKSMKLHPLESADLPEVADLYKTLFSGFPKLDYLKQKLKNKQGRGFILRNETNKIISIVQTDFEEDGKAIITGVGTAREYQRNGLAYMLMQHTQNELKRARFQKLYLQYDDEKAGKLYNKLGYKIEARMGNLINQKTD